jgi:hypothetical protein
MSWNNLGPLANQIFTNEIEAVRDSSVVMSVLQMIIKSILPDEILVGSSGRTNLGMLHETEEAQKTLRLHMLRR